MGSRPRPNSQTQRGAGLDFRGRGALHNNFYFKSAFRKYPRTQYKYSIKVHRYISDSAQPSLARRTVCHSRRGMKSRDDVQHRLGLLFNRMGSVLHRLPAPPPPGPPPPGGRPPGLPRVPRAGPGRPADRWVVGLKKVVMVFGVGWG